MTVVKLAIPKGSLEKATFDFLSQAGYTVSGESRTYRPKINDPGVELRLLRPQEIPTYVAEGIADLAVTGEDWIAETEADVRVLTNLEYGRVKLVAGVSKILPVDSLSELLEYLWSRGRNVRISTEYLKVTSRWVKSNPTYRRAFGDQSPTIITPWWRVGENPKVSIFLSFGATEAKPPDVADLVVDVTETGSTFEANNLKQIETVLESSAVLIANKQSLLEPEKREKIYDILALFKGVVSGRRNLHIFVNVKKENLQELLVALPALKKPTVSQLSDPEWYSVNSVVEKSEFLQLLPTLRRLAQGLVVHEPRQILPLEEMAQGGEGGEGGG